MIIRRAAPWLIGVFAGAIAGSIAAAGPDSRFADLYAEHSMRPPTAGSMIVCYGFVCRRRIEIAFSQRDRAAVEAVFAKANAKASAEAERAAVAQTVGWFDRRMGPLIGTSRRVARADFRTFDDDHNYDCVDTSTNTTSLLLLLDEWKLLRHHRVDLPRYRGNLLVGQTPHNTAVLTELATGKGWSIDMWTTRYGEPAEVMPIERWMTEN